MSRPALILSAIAGCLGGKTIGAAPPSPPGPSELARPAAEGPAAEVSAAFPGFALIELFTSEGCSSCPPADRLLAVLAAEAAQRGQPVHVLSFHVDYWDDLGWADPFGRPAFANRQRAYAAALGDGAYTPQMIVNGRLALAGADAAKARRAVRAALIRPAPVRIGRLEARSSGGNVHVTCAAAGPPAGTLLRLALALPDTAVPVPRGENSGRTLRHHGVVLAFATVRLSAGGEGHAVLTAPAGVRAESLRLIAYAQDPESMAVLGAAETAVRP
jgi:hypothetical protein